MRVVNVTPPFFLFTGPASAPSVLTSVLREFGHDAINFDVSRYCFERLLSTESIVESLSVDGADGLSPSEIHARRILPTSLGLAVRSLQSGDAFNSMESYHAARLDIELALRAHSRRFGRTRWTSSGYQGDHDRTDPHDLLDAVVNRSEVFDAPVDDAARLITEHSADLVGISVSAPQQLYGALRLAAAIKSYAPRIHVSLGGATTTRLRRSIAAFPQLFNLVDSVLLREGESSFVSLAEALENRVEPLTHVPEMLARRDGVVVLSSGFEEGIENATTDRFRLPVKPVSNLADLPLPIFEDLHAGDYLIPNPLLPLSTTRNCYYDKCDFCSISKSFNRMYREMTAQQIVRQMSRLSDQFPKALFKDVSEALPPRLLDDVADELDQTGLQFSWEAYLRFERPFDNSNVADRLARSGLRVAYLGLETASQRLVDEMDKNIDIQVAERTIRRFADAGIWVHLFLMAGHPSETEADHHSTLEFLRRNGRYIHSIQAGGFQLEIDSKLTQLSSRHGFRICERVEPTFDMGFAFERLGTVPAPETIERRVAEIRQVAQEESGDVLAASQHVWDAHKIVFCHREGRPTLPVEPEKTAMQGDRV